MGSFIILHAWSGKNIRSVFSHFRDDGFCERQPKGIADCIEANELGDPTGRLRNMVQAQERDEGGMIPHDWL